MASVDLQKIEQDIQDAGELLVFTRDGEVSANDNSVNPDVQPGLDFSIHCLIVDTNVESTTGELTLQISPLNDVIPTNGDRVVFLNRTYTITSIMPLRAFGETLSYTLIGGF